MVGNRPGTVAGVPTTCRTSLWTRRRTRAPADRRDGLANSKPRRRKGKAANRRRKLASSEPGGTSPLRQGRQPKQTSNNQMATPLLALATRKVAQSRPWVQDVASRHPLAPEWRLSSAPIRRLHGDASTAGAQGVHTCHTSPWSRRAACGRHQSKTRALQKSAAALSSASRAKQPVTGPMVRYKELVEKGTLKDDDHQRSIVSILQSLHDELRRYHHTEPSHPLGHKEEAPRGLVSPS